MPKAPAIKLENPDDFIKWSPQTTFFNWCVYVNGVESVSARVLLLVALVSHLKGSLVKIKSHRQAKEHHF